MKRTTKAQNTSVYSAVSLGALLALVLSFAGAMVVAFMQSGEKLAEDAVFPATIIIWAIAAFAGGLLSAKLLGKQYVLSAALANLCYFLLLTAMGILFFDSNFKTALTAFLAMIAGTIPVLIIFLNNKPGKSRKIKYKVR